MLLMTILGVALVALTLPGTVELVLLTLASLRPRRPARAAGRPLRLAVVVPAHDEEASVARAVESLRRSERVGPRFAVVVVADNCADRTAARAEAAGARVLVRRDPDRRGKGHALRFAFDRLLAEGWEALAVVDADTEVDRRFVPEIRATLSGAGAAQACYLVRNRGSLRTRLLHVSLLAMNLVRPRGRAALGLSAGILGNGFALTAETLARVPYEATSIVEDLEYHLRLVRGGIRVRFAEGATVRGDMPVRAAGFATQRARWEGGRLRMLREHVPGLLRDVLRGRLRQIEPLLDLLLLPLGFHVALLAAALAIPTTASRAYAACGLAAVAGHLVVALVLGRALPADVAALAAAPVYVAWKIARLPATLRASHPGARWQRTDRHRRVS